VRIAHRLSCPVLCEQIWVFFKQNLVASFVYGQLYFFWILILVQSSVYWLVIFIFCKVFHFLISSVYWLVVFIFCKVFHFLSGKFLDSSLNHWFLYWQVCQKSFIGKFSQFCLFFFSSREVFEIFYIFQIQIFPHPEDCLSALW